jgi:hypothetical protein
VTDSRPRPEYGEYATPEEQAAAIGTVPEAVQDITPQAVVPNVTPAPALAAGQPRRWDMIATVLLLAIGAYVTVASFGQYADMQNTLQQTYAAYGYTGTFPNPDLTRTIGVTLNIVQPVVLILAALLSARFLRAGRVAFWIPLVGGVFVTIVTGVLFAVIVGADPAFVTYFTEQASK